VAPEPVDPGALRRFTQAIMESSPVYVDAEVATASRFGAVVAPPLFPLHAQRRHPGTPDPLDTAFVDPDFDGVGTNLMETLGLPEPDLGLSRLLNGGNEIDVYELARVGDLIGYESEIVDIEEKTGRSGRLAFVTVETLYRAVNRDALLLRSRQTNIFR
jgi:hypothetical protein